MARRSAKLAIVRGVVREAQSIPSPAEGEICELETHITSHRDQPLPALLKDVVERVRSLSHAEGAAVAVSDQSGVVCRASTGDAPEVGSRLRSDSALTRECFETGQAVVCEDTEKDCRVHRSIADSLRLRSVVVVPLRTRDSVRGVLEVLSSRPFAFDLNHVAGLQRIAEALAPALAPALPEGPAENVLLSRPEQPGAPKSRVRAYLAAGAIILLLLLLLFFTALRLWQVRRLSSPAPPASTPAESLPPAVGPPDTQAKGTQTRALTADGSSHREFSARTASASLPTETTTSSQPAAGSTTIPPEKPPAAENQAEAAIRPTAPAQSSDVQPGETPSGNANIEPFDLQALSSPAKAPIFVVTTAIPAPVIATRTSPPDFVLDRTLKGHSGWVTGLAFSPDGLRLASGSWDQTVKFWEVSTGQQLGTIARKTKEIQALAFSRDGRWLATENSANTVTLRDATTGQEVRTFPSDQPLGALARNWVYSIAFSPDGRWLASGADDQTVRLWDVTTGGKVRDFRGSRRSVIYVAFSPDGRLLASGDDDKSIRIWDVASGEQVYKLSGHKKPVYAVAFSPNGRWLASASGDKTVKVWDVASGREVHSLTSHGNVVTSLVFSPDGRWLVSGSWDKTIKIWEVETGREVQTLAGHDHSIYSVAFDSRGQWLASGSEDGTIKLWHLAEAVDQSRLR